MQDLSVLMYGFCSIQKDFFNFKNPAHIAF